MSRCLIPRYLDLAAWLFLNYGKQNVRFLLSLQTIDLQGKPLIGAPVHGRDDDFLQSHQL